MPRRTRRARDDGGGGGGVAHIADGHVGDLDRPVGVGQRGVLRQQDEDWRRAVGPRVRHAVRRGVGQRGGVASAGG